MCFSCILDLHPYLFNEFRLLLKTTKSHVKLYGINKLKDYLIFRDGSFLLETGRLSLLWG
jgi:hypothetical protein